jgi:hypothetical protein
VPGERHPAIEVAMVASRHVGKKRAIQNKADFRGRRH